MDEIIIIDDIEDTAPICELNGDGDFIYEMWPNILDLDVFLFSLIAFGPIDIRIAFIPILINLFLKNVKAVFKIDKYHQLIYIFNEKDLEVFDYSLKKTINRIEYQDIIKFEKQNKLKNRVLGIEKIICLTENGKIDLGSIKAEKYNLMNEILYERR